MHGARLLGVSGELCMTTKMRELVLRLRQTACHTCFARDGTVEMSVTQVTVLVINSTFQSFIHKITCNFSEHGTVEMLDTQALRRASSTRKKCNTQIAIFFLVMELTFFWYPKTKMYPRPKAQMHTGTA